MRMLVLINFQKRNAKIKDQAIQQQRRVENTVLFKVETILWKMFNKPWQSQFLIIFSVCVFIIYDRRSSSGVLCK